MHSVKYFFFNSLQIITISISPACRGLKCSLYDPVKVTDKEFLFLFKVSIILNAIFLFFKFGTFNYLVFFDEKSSHIKFEKAFKEITISRYKPPIQYTCTS